MSSEIDPPPPYIGYSMRLVWLWIWERIVEVVVDAGYDDVTPGHISLFRYPGLEGQRLTEVARRMQITKQSVHQLIGDLERLGYLVRETDPANRRARLIRLTRKGQGLQEIIRRQAQASQRRIADIVGPRRFAQLESALALLVDDITLGRQTRKALPRNGR